MLDLNLPIDSVDVKNLSVEEFKKKYFKPQIPVILKGLAYEQPAGEKWQLDWFKETMGDVTVDLYDNRLKHHEYSTTTKPDVQMPFRDYIDIIKKDENTPLRMFLFNLYKHNKDLKKDFANPKYITGLMKGMGYMFFGGKDTDVRLHYDIDNSNVILTQFGGEKRVVLFAPEYSDLLYRMPFNTHSNIDVFKASHEEYPALKYVKGYDFVLEHGDAIFMPSGYWHYNTYLNGGMGVSYRMMPSNIPGMFKGVMNVGPMMALDKMLNRAVGGPWIRYKERLMDRRMDRAIKKYSKNDNNSGTNAPVQETSPKAEAVTV